MNARLKVQLPFEAKKIAEMHAFIEQRFASKGGYQFLTIRAIAHAMVERIVAGDVDLAKCNMDVLVDPGAHDIRAALKKIMNFEFE